MPTTSYRKYTQPRQPRTLDRMLWALRSHIRSHDLPRPVGLTMSTTSQATQITFGTGEGTARLRKLIAWGESLNAVSVTWLVLPNRHLVVTLAGLLPCGAGVIVSAGADVACFGGCVITTGAGQGVFLPGYRRMSFNQVGPVELEDLRALTAKVSRGRSGVAA